jgi:phage regulator Rha-like protein
MNDLVFLEPNKIDTVPFTTSDVIAEYAKISHHAIQQMISKHEVNLKKFGQVAFEMRKLSGELSVPCETESIMKPAFKMRPLKQSVTGQSEKIYHLNEQQATILITFLKNTEPVINFKVELVKQFYLMRSELQKRQIAKIERKPIRLSLTDAIDALPVSPNKGRKYGQYTDLIYKTLLGKSAKQIREENNALRKATASDYLMAEQLIEITKMECRVAVLIEMGLDYYQIKALLLNRQMVAA